MPTESDLDRAAIHLRFILEGLIDSLPDSDMAQMDVIRQNQINRSLRAGRRDRRRGEVSDGEAARLSGQ
jgi:hypothetical protein